MIETLLNTNINNYINEYIYIYIPAHCNGSAGLIPQYNEVFTEQSGEGGKS